MIIICKKDGFLEREREILVAFVWGQFKATENDKVKLIMLCFVDAVTLPLTNNAKKSEY